MAALRSESSDRLGRICGGCALALLVCIIALELLDARGIGRQFAAPVITLVALALYCAAALATSTADPLEFHIASRRIPAGFAGMAAAAQWSAPALLLAAPASLFVAGYDGRPMLIGLTGGYVLLAILIAPFMRNRSARSATDFILTRYGTVAGLIAAAMLLICSLLFMTALIGTALAFIARVLAIDWRVALAIGMAVVLFCAIGGGMASVIASQAAQYTVLLIVTLAVFFLLAAKPFDTPAEAPYDPVMAAIDLLTQGLGLVPAPSPRSVPFHISATVEDLEFMICLIAGTSALPHVVMHPLTTRGIDDARKWAGQSLLFITILVFALPSYVKLANSAAALELSGIMAGLVATIAATITIAAASAVLFAMAVTLTGAGKAAVLPTRVLVIVIAAGVGYVLATQPLEGPSMLAWSFSLAAAGLFPAIVLGVWWRRATTAGAVLGMLSGFSISLLYVVLTRYFPQAGIAQFGMTALSDPASGRPLVDAARILADPRWHADIPAGLANPLASKVGWFNVGNEACGIFGMAIGFAITIAISLISKKPSAEKQELMESMRAPKS
jgi:cation/acetate symporter